MEKLPDSENRTYVNFILPDGRSTRRKIENEYVQELMSLNIKDRLKRYEELTGTPSAPVTPRSVAKPQTQTLPQKQPSVAQKTTPSPQSTETKTEARPSTSAAPSAASSSRKGEVREFVYQMEDADDGRFSRIEDII